MTRQAQEANEQSAKDLVAFLIRNGISGVKRVDNVVMYPVAGDTTVVVQVKTVRSWDVLDVAPVDL